MKKNIVMVALVVLVLFVLFPHLMGVALVDMTIWFGLVYYGYKGSMKVRGLPRWGLSSPFLAFFSSLAVFTIYLALFGQPDSNTQWGLVLVFGVPMLVTFFVVTFFYFYEKSRPKVTPEQAVHHTDKNPDISDADNHRKDISRSNGVLSDPVKHAGHPATDQPPQQMAANWAEAASTESTSAIPAQSGGFDEDTAYTQIADEIETQRMDKGLWTRLLAETDGDEMKTKVLYIRQRAARLISDGHARLVQATQQAEDRKRLELVSRKPQVLVDPELVSAVWAGNWATASTLLINGVEPTGYDENGNSLLDLAKKRGDRQMIELLETYASS